MSRIEGCAIGTCTQALKQVGSNLRVVCDQLLTRARGPLEVWRCVGQLRTRGFGQSMYTSREVRTFESHLSNDVEERPVSRRTEIGQSIVSVKISSIIYCGCTSLSSFC